jgi:hypothetical protein
MLQEGTASLEKVLDTLLELIDSALTELNHNEYEAEIQKLEAKVRKHIKVIIRPKSDRNRIEAILRASITEALRISQEIY